MHEQRYIDRQMHKHTYMERHKHTNIYTHNGTHKNTYAHTQVVTKRYTNTHTCTYINIRHTHNKQICTLVENSKNSTKTTIQEEKKTRLGQGLEWAHLTNNFLKCDMASLVMHVRMHEYHQQKETLLKTNSKIMTKMAMQSIGEGERRNKRKMVKQRV